MTRAENYVTLEFLSRSSNEGFARIAAAGFAAAGHNGGAQVTQLRYILCQVFVCVVPRRGNQS